jgi:hypothetical protein
MNRRDFLVSGVAGLMTLQDLSGADVKKASPAPEGELLYNGIRLPPVWPPPRNNGTLHLPSSPAYLAQPPAVIPIDVGRQLLSMIF